jgi:hypothetical protein
MSTQCNKMKQQECVFGLVNLLANLNYAFNGSKINKIKEVDTGVGFWCDLFYLPINKE